MRTFEALSGEAVSGDVQRGKKRRALGVWRLVQHPSRFFLQV